MRLVQWYPGHIARAEKLLKEQLRGVDAVVEVRPVTKTTRTANSSIFQSHHYIENTTSPFQTEASFRSYISFQGLGLDPIMFPQFTQSPKKSTERTARKAAAARAVQRLEKNPVCFTTHDPKKTSTHPAPPRPLLRPAQVRDIRIPLATTHPEIPNWIGSKLRILVLNRADMAGFHGRM